MIRHHLTNLINKKSDKDQKTIIRKKKKKEKETKKKKKVHLTKNKTNTIRVGRNNFSHNSLISCFPTSIKHSFLQRFHLCYLFFWCCLLGRSSSESSSLSSLSSLLVLLLLLLLVLLLLLLWLPLFPIKLIHQSLQLRRHSPTRLLRLRIRIIRLPTISSKLLPRAPRQLLLRLRLQIIRLLPSRLLSLSIKPILFPFRGLMFRPNRLGPSSSRSSNRSSWVGHPCWEGHFFVCFFVSFSFSFSFSFLFCC